MRSQAAGHWAASSSQASDGQAESEGAGLQAGDSSGAAADQMATRGSGPGSGAKSVFFLVAPICHTLPSLTLVLCLDVFPSTFLCGNDFTAAKGPNYFEIVTRQQLGCVRALLGPLKSDLMNSQNLWETTEPSFVLLETCSAMCMQV